jgi:hypothetical protein
VTLPITLGLLMDTSGSEQYMLGAIQEGASSFLNRVMRKGDEAMVMTFDLDVDLLSDFTDDRSQLNRAIHKAQINTGGGGGPVTPGTIPSSGAKGTNFYDALYLACNENFRPKRAAKPSLSLPTPKTMGAKSAWKKPSKPPSVRIPSSTFFGL